MRRGFTKIQNLLRRPKPSRARPQPWRSSRWSIPSFEQLEDRVMPASQPVATLLAPAQGLLGQNLTLSLTFANASPTTTGYGPYLDLYLPASGVDGNDGISFVSATYLGTTINAITRTFDATGHLTHPLAKNSSGNFIVESGTKGDQLAVLPLPFNAFTPAQPTAAVSVTVSVSNLAKVGAGLNVKADAAFQYGNDPLDDPTVDPTITSASQSAVVTPSVIVLSTAYVGPENETATGPNFPRQYSVTVSVANGQTITNLNVSDVLPNNLQFVSVNSTTINGAAASTTAVSTPSTTTPGGTLTRQFASVTGNGSANSAQMLFTVYVPLNNASGAAVIDPNTGAPSTAVSNTSAQGTWTPLNPLYPTTTVTASQSPAHTLNVLSLAAQQSAAVYTDTGTPGPSPGDTLEYTLYFQVSDYFSFQNLHLTDVISDGQRFDPSFTPTLSVNGNGFTLPAAGFQAANYVVTPHYSAPPGDGNPNDGTDGTTGFDFRLSNEMISRGQNGRLLGGLVSPTGSGLVAPPGAGPITGTVKFHAIIQEAYTDAYGPPNQIVKQGDTLTSAGVVSGDVISNTTFLPTGSTATNTHAASVTIPHGSLAASIYAINGSTSLPSPLLVAPGDNVTYRLRYTLPTSDVRNLSLTDFLPPPVYNAGAVTTFNYVSSATPPALNVAALGPADTFHTLFPGVVPTFTTVTTNGNNELVFNYGNNSDPLDQTSVIDLLFTAQIGGQPFPDGTPLTNLVQVVEQGSSPAVNASAQIVMATLTEPSVVKITKGVVSTNNPNGVFAPSTVGPTGVTFGAPGTSPGFTGTITSGGLAGHPVNSDLSKVDAGDLVRFAIVIENVGQGRNGAFNVQFKDTLPAGFQVPAGGLDLYVTDGTGAAFTTTDLGGGLFGSGLALNDPGPTATPPGGLDPGKDGTGATVSTGRNLAVITYDLQATDTVDPGQVITNTATLLNYASIPGGPDFTAGVTDVANVTIARPVVTKTVTATSQAFTTGSNVAIGEIATYQVVITVPEGVTPAAQLVDTLPAGLAIVSLDTISASAALQTSVTGGFPAVLSGATVGSNGSSATFNFGTVTNTDRNNAVAETITLGYRVVALNVAANQRGTVDTNSAKFVWNLGNVAGTTPLTVVTPALQVADAAAPATADVGDVVTYTVVLSHTSRSNANAYDVPFSDVLPSYVTYVPGSLRNTAGLAPDAGSLQFSGGTVSANYATFATGQTSTLTFQATLNANVQAGQPIADAATLKWTSLPGVVTFPESPYNALSVERTGNTTDPGGSANNFITTGSATVRVFLPGVTKTILSTSQAFTTGNNVAIGEEAQYQLQIAMPESVTPSMSLKDTLPAGLAIVSLDSITATPTITTSHPGGFAGVLHDAVVGSGGGSVTFPLDTLTDTTLDTSPQEYVTLTYTVVVLNVAGNVRGTTLTNSATLSFPYGSVTGSAPALTVVEPTLQVVKSVAPTTGDAGGPAVTFTFVVSHAAASNANTYDVALSDVIPGGFTYVAGSLRNSAGQAPTTLGIAGATITATYTTFALGATSTLTFQVTLNGTTTPGQVVTNTAGATWTSLPGIVNVPESPYNALSVERTGNTSDPGGAANTYSTSGSAGVTVNANTLSGFVYLDNNNNGIKDTGEAGLAGVLLTLTGTDNLANPVTRTATTDVNGAYGFTLLRPGSYRVTKTPPPAYLDGLDTVGTPALGATNSVADQLGVYSFPLGASTSSVNNNFAEAPWKLCGTVFVDLNGNGVIDAGEVGLAGVTITLLSATNTVLATQVSASDGSYAFHVFAGASYTLAETVPTNYDPSTPTQIIVAMPAHDVLGQNFGLLPCGINYWTFSQQGGSANGKGTETPVAQDPGILIKEGDSLTVTLERDFVVPASPALLTVEYTNLSFDTTAVGRIKDAFEMALVDANNQPLVAPYAPRRQAFFNITEGMPAALGRGASVIGSNVSVDISALTPGTTARVLLRLDNNDGDTNTSVQVGCMSLSEAPSYLYRVPGAAGSVSAVTFTATGVGPAALSNELGVALVDNLVGSVNGLLPGQPGYAQAVLRHATRQVVFAQPAAAGNRFTLDLPAGSLVLPYLVQNGTTYQALLNNPNDQMGSAPHVWFAVPAANPDLFAHFVRTQTTSQASTFAVEDGDNGGNQDFTDLTFTIASASASAPPKFFVADAAADATFTYNAAGSFVNETKLAAGDTAPRGIATNRNSNLQWVVDANKGIYVYDNHGNALGSWTASDAVNPQGIATDNTDVWVLDAGQNKVLRYAAAAALRGGSLTSTGSFALSGSNTQASDITTDGTNFWVTDQGQRDVFVYSLSGTQLGQWYLDFANTNPSGITVNPAGGTDLWVVSRTTATVYHYATGTTLRYGFTSATDHFALAAGDTQPEGIADPRPVVTIQTPAPGSSFQAGGPVLITGKALPGSAPLAQLTINGSPVTALDAAGDFFVQVTLPAGQTNYTVTAKDTSGQTAQASVTVTGTPPPGPGQIDFTQLSDVTPNFTPAYGRTSYYVGYDVLYADLSATNTGTFAIDTPLLVEVTNISVPSVRMRDADGVAPDGTFYYDYSKLISGGTVLPQGSIGTRSLAFYDPEQVPFTYRLVFLGHLNHPPRFTSVPQVRVWTGGGMYPGNYNYTATAADPDQNETLHFTLLYGPQYMSINSTTGQVSWPTPYQTAGTHAVGIKVDDGRGLSAEQDFVVTVSSLPQNLAPYFTSTPVVDANVNTPYVYNSTATDADGDMPLMFSVVSGPAGLTIAQFGGQVTWTPTPAQLGVQTVTLQVADMFGNTGQQTYKVLVQNQPGNAPPIIISTPILTVPAGQTYAYPVNAIDADAASANETLIYSVVSGPAAMTIDPTGGLISWPTTTADLGPHAVTVRVDDGRGAYDTQTFTVTVVSPVTPAAILGTKWNDLNANGIRDVAYINAPTTLQPIDLKQVPLQHVPLTIDYYQPANEVMIATFINPPQGPHGEGMGNGLLLELVQTNGTETTFATVPSVTLGDGINIATVWAGNTAHFTTGDVFTPVTGYFGQTGGPPQILRVTNGGATVVNPWVTLPYNASGFVTELCMDRTGVFGDNLLAMTSGGQIWEIDYLGNPTLLVSGLVAGGDGALITVPNDVTTYGPLAGKILAISDGNSAVTVDPLGVVATLSLAGLNSGEGLSVIPAAANFFALADGDPNVSVASYNQFAPIQGQIVVAHEAGSFNRVWWDGTQLQSQALPFTPASVTNKPWEQVAMMPVSLGPVGLTLEPGLANWTIYLDTNNNGRLDPGEPYTLTDSAGNYSFTNLAPGTYTVAEVPQPGWQQTAPATGTFTVTLTSSQVVQGLNFGNHRVPADPNQLPVISSNAPTSAVVGATYLYNVVAGDGDGDALAFDLPVRPADMAIDPQAGIIAWKPTASEIGIQNVLLRVQDGRGGVALQSFQVSVVRANTAPIITSTAPSPAVVGVPYQYNVKAQDAEGDPLTYHLDSGPADGMALNAATGALTWTPQSADVGTVSVTLDVNDSHGGDTFQTFNLSVITGATNLAPTITSTPRTSIQIGQNYLYEVQAGDADGDPLTYSLPTAPAGMTISAAGVVFWVPTAAQYGNNNVVVQVSDGRPGGTVTQGFTVQVVTTQTNQPPVITSLPPLVATVSQTYAYNLTGSDPNGDPLSWSLTTAPLGMSVDPNLGTVRWIPLASQVGSAPVTVRVVDPQGASATQSFTITVKGENTPPIITSTPVFQVMTGQPYAYAVVAGDADGDVPLTYSLPTAPAGMTIDNTGLISWTAGAVGNYSVVVRVDDGQGFAVTQSYTLNVQTTNDQPPVITSRPPLQAVTGVLYSYQVQANDPDGDVSLTYSLGAHPQGMTISPTGLIQWTPSQMQFGPPYVQVLVTDSAQLQAEQYYFISLTVNYAPQITSQAVTSVTAGQAYQYDVAASDQDGDALTYSLSGAPMGMTIDDLGRITWQTAPANVGTYNNITVTVTDVFGVTATQTFNLTVNPDTQAPVVELRLSPNPVVIGNQETFLVLATDNVGVVSESLTVSGVNLPLDDKGQAVVTENTAGFFNVVATATDAAGNVSTPATATLQVTNPNAQAPTVQINPLPNGNVVTAPTNITGTVSAVTGFSYTVTLIPFDGSPSKQIGGGSTAVNNGALAPFDPTLLANGDYTVQVTANDNNGNSTTASLVVHVEGELKLGREQLSVTDLTIPVAGIPIRVIRSYDSLDAGKSLDFGYGWTLSFGNAKLQVDLVPGAGIGWGGYPAFLDGTHVYVTLPGGKREGFTFQPWEESQFFGIIDYWHPNFVPDPGVLDDLTAPDQLLSKDLSTGEYYTIQDSGLETYNPEDPVYGDQYTVTNLVGIGYQVAADTGQLTGMTARNGNSLTFSDTAVTSNTGKTVLIDRDAQGRILDITDPRGNSLHYSYDTAGNLVAVTDRMGDPPTTYAYDPNHPHFLSSVTDPLGVQQLQMVYDASGRLQQWTDAKGNPTTFTYDTSALTETVSDPLTPTSTLTFDARGNVKQLTDPTGARSSATYNNAQPADKDLPDTVTHLRRNSDGTTTSLTTQLSYDAKAEVTSSTDPTGAVTRVTYGAFGEGLTVSDALGNTTTYTYDDNGNLLRTVTAQGVETDYGYDSHNNVTQVTQGGTGAAFTYDSSSYVSSSTTPTSVTTNFGYDANGNPTGTSFNWVNPNNSSDVRTVTTSAAIDANDRQTSATDEYSHTSQVRYDVKGRVTQATDVLGNSTAYVYDARDQVIQTNYPDGTVSRTVYDADGRPVYGDDPHVDGQPTYGTHTIYDSLGQVKERDRVANLVLAVTTTNGVSDSQVVSAGTVVSSTTGTYNDLGQVTQSVDAANQLTQYQYDAAGRQTGFTDALNETASATYDAAGRQISTTDALGHTTQSTYDGDGRVTKTTFADGSFATTAYDSRDRVSSVTDEMSRTTQYQYDSSGRTTAVIMPTVYDPVTQQNVQPTTQYGYDAYGDLVSIKDAKQQTTQFAFDQFGHPLTRTLPMGQVETTTYDNYGRVATHTDFKGQVEKLHYDALGRVDSKTFWASASATTPGETVSYQFDALGRVSQVTDTIGSATRVTQYGYDQDNRVTSVTTPEGAVNYVYDPATGFLKETYTLNSDIRYAPDALQRVQLVSVVKQNGVTLTTPLVTNYYYTKVGNLDHVTFANGTETDYGYDLRDRLTSVTDKQGATVLASYVYTLQADGLETGATETDATGTVTKTWTYDALKRLTSETYTSTIAANNYADQYTYDLAGNRLSKTHTAGGQTLVSTYQYNSNGELTTETGTVGGTTTYQTTYGYDANGSLTSLSRTGTGAESDSYTFDLQDRMATANVSRTEGGQAVTIAAAYTYDEAGPRAQAVVTTTIGAGSPTTTTTQYLNDAGNPTGFAQVLEEHTNGSAAPSMSYLVGLSVLGQTDGSGATSFLLTDGKGSTRLVTNGAGAVTARYDYDAYGGALGAGLGVTNPPATRILYRGEQFDPALGSYYFRDRYYLPGLGVFSARDPIGWDSTDPLRNIPYAYAADNPIAYLDQSGDEFSASETLSVSGIQNQIEVGLNYIGTALKIYDRVQKLIRLLEYAKLALRVIRALHATTPEGAAVNLVNEIANLAGNVTADTVISGFNLALKTIKPHWKKINNAILRASQRIATDAATNPRFLLQMPRYLASLEADNLALVFYAPTGPGGGRTGDRLIRISGTGYVAVSALGGRLFGFGLRTIDQRGNQADQVFRIDYWDIRHPPERPTLTPLNIHYHLFEEDDHHPDGDRNIWGI